MYLIQRSDGRELRYDDQVGRGVTAADNRHHVGVGEDPEELALHVNQDISRDIVISYLISVRIRERSLVIVAPQFGVFLVEVPGYPCRALPQGEDLGRDLVALPLAAPRLACMKRVIHHQSLKSIFPEFDEIFILC